MINKLGLLLLFNVVGTFVPGYALDLDEVMRNLIYPAQVSYQGEETIIFWTTRGASISTKIKIYVKPGKLRIEYLTPKNMQTTVLIDDGNFVYSYDTAAKKALQLKTSSFKTENGELKYGLLKKNYKPVFLRDTKIDQQQAEIILIKPINPANPSREITVAKQNSAVLEEKLFNLTDNLIYNSYFTDIDFSFSPPDSLFTLPEDVKIIKPAARGESASQSFEDVTEAFKHINFKFHLPAYLPNGYIFEKVVIFSEKDKKYVQLQYYDGLNSISLFETLFNISISAQLNLQLNESKLVEGEVVKVFYNIPSNLIYKKLNYMNCFIIANMSQDELSKMLLSLK
jgi:outer membrane lipoprotein-sorting protein